MGQLSHVATKFHFHDGNMTVERSQDCTAILEHAKAMQSAGQVGGTEMRFAGTIPDVIVEAYCNRKGIDYREFMTNPVHIKAVMNDPDLKGFRVWEGRV